MSGRTTWTPEKCEYLRNNWYTDLTISEIAKHLGTTERAVYQKAYTLRMRKKTKSRTVAHKAEKHGGKHFRKCLPPDRHDDMLRFLALVNSVPQNMIKKGEFINIDLLELLRAYQSLGTGGVAFEMPKMREGRASRK